MPYVLHVCAYLMCATRFEYTFNQRNISKWLEHLPMRYGIFATLGVIGNVHHSTVGRGTLKIAHNGALFVFETAPHKGIVLPFNRMVKKLFGKHYLCFFVLGNQQ